MSKVMRLLNLNPRGRHAADPITAGELAQPQPAVTRAAVIADRSARHQLTVLGGAETTVIPALQVPVPEPPPRDRWLPAAQTCAMLPAVRYPDCGEYPDRAPVMDREGYAAAMRHISRITATSSRYENPAAWPCTPIEAGPGTAFWASAAGMQAEAAVRQATP